MRAEIHQSTNLLLPDKSNDFVIAKIELYMLLQDAVVYKNRLYLFLSEQGFSLNFSQLLLMASTFSV